MPRVMQVADRPLCAWWRLPRKGRPRARSKEIGSRCALRCSAAILLVDVGPSAGSESVQCLQEAFLRRNRAGVAVRIQRTEAQHIILQAVTALGEEELRPQRRRGPRAAGSDQTSEVKPSGLPRVPRQGRQSVERARFPEVASAYLWSAKRYSRTVQNSRVGDAAGFRSSSRPSRTRVSSICSIVDRRDRKSSRGDVLLQLCFNSSPPLQERRK